MPEFVIGDIGMEGAVEVPPGVHIEHEDAFGVEFSIPFSTHEPPADGGLGFEEASLADLQDVSNQGARGEFWEDKWGTAEENEAILEGRAHYSVRELNKLHARRIKDTIIEYTVVRILVAGLTQKGCPLYGVSPETLRQIVAHASPHSEPLVYPMVEQLSEEALNRELAHFRICVRKRPMLPFEKEADEFDVVETDIKRGTIVCHDGQLARSGRRLTMAHKYYHFDRVWGQHADNRTVFMQEVKPLVEWSMQGRCSTVLCYGQTGTGKTHTMNGMLTHVATALAGEHVEVVFFEVHAKKAFDLLCERKEVKLLADENERVHVRGAKTVDMPSLDSGTLMTVLEEGLKLRSVEVTERNPISSRSHAFVELRILSKGGKITLVDLAGSERKHETLKMTPAQHKESAEINKALMALKDCFHAFHVQLEKNAPAGQKEIQFNSAAAKHDAKSAALIRNKSGTTRVPFRASKLTQVLRESFTDPAHKTLVIASVAPTPTDLQHTLNSLDHVILMAPPLARTMASSKVDVAVYQENHLDIPVQEWTHEQVVMWIATVEAGRFSKIALPPNITGAKLLSVSERKLCELFAGDLRQGRNEGEGGAWVVDSDAGEVLGRALYRSLRNEQMFIRKRQLQAQGKTVGNHPLFT